MNAQEPGRPEWPATPIQARMAGHDETSPHSGFYVLPFTWSVAGNVDWPAFDAAFEAICRRYPVLRGSVRRAGEGWVQSVQPYERVRRELRDASTVGGPDLDRLLEASYEEFCRQPFRLAEDPPVRALVLQLETEFLVLGAFHAAVCDIESMAVFISEFSDLYEGFAAGSPAELPAVELDFGTYARQAVQTRREQADSNLGYWREQLSGVAVRCPLPVDHPEGLDNPTGPVAYLKIGAQELARAAHAIATRQRCSEHAVLLAAFAGALSRRSGGGRFLVSLPVSQRRTAASLKVFGPLSDLAWLPVGGTDGPLADTLRPTFTDILGALAHPCPVDVVSTVAAPPMGEGPTVQCQYFPPERVENPEWVTASVRVRDVLPVYLLTGPLDSPFWLELTIAGEHKQENTDFSLVYRCDLFHPDTVRAICSDIESAILEAAALPVAG